MLLLSITKNNPQKTENKMTKSTLEAQIQTANQEAIAMGCFFECPCGEISTTLSHALYCKKCRQYEIEGDIIDIRTGEVIK